MKKNGKIINGKIIAEKIKDEIVQEVLELKGRRPNLAIILVGERDDSKLYVSLKEKAAKLVGVDTHLYKCSAGIKEEELIEMIKLLNKDDEIDAILVQFPLPKNINSDKIVRQIKKQKDVDQFHPDNLKNLRKAYQTNKIISPVFSAVIKVLDKIKFNLKNKVVCLVVNSDIFGKSLAEILKGMGAEVKVIKSSDKKLNKKIIQADVIITAVGKAKLIKKEAVKEGAVVIDIGVVKQGKKISGDVDFENVIKKVSHITPVPGGIGPITVAMLLKNTVALMKQKK